MESDVDATHGSTIADQERSTDDDSVFKQFDDAVAGDARDPYPEPAAARRATPVQLLERLPNLRLDPDADDPHIGGQVFRSPTSSARPGAGPRRPRRRSGTARRPARRRRVPRTRGPWSCRPPTLPVLFG